MKNKLNSNKSFEDIWNESINEWFPKTYYAQIAPLISDYLNNLNQHNSILDFGCGFGSNSFIFHNLGLNVTGIDSSTERINKARIDYPQINFTCYKFENKLPFEDNSFDIIYSNSVLQYVSHKSFINECQRVLKENGRVIFIENLRNNPITRTGRLILKVTKSNYQSFPWNHFTLEEIMKVQNQFYNSKLVVFHLFSPLACFKPLKKFYPFLYRIDNYLLKLSFLKRFYWLVLFTGTKETLKKL